MSGPVAAALDAAYELARAVLTDAHFFADDDDRITSSRVEDAKRVMALIDLARKAK